MSEHGPVLLSCCPCRNNPHTLTGVLDGIAQLCWLSDNHQLCSSSVPIFDKVTQVYRATIVKCIVPHFRLHRMSSVFAEHVSNSVSY